MSINEYRDKVQDLRIDIINKVSKAIETTDTISSTEYRDYAEATAFLLQGIDNFGEMMNYIKELQEKSRKECQEQGGLLGFNGSN